MDWLQRGGEMPAHEPEPTYSAPLARWIAETPEGQSSTKAAREWMQAAIDALPGAPAGNTFYRLLLVAFQSLPTLDPAKGAAAATFTRGLLDEDAT